MKKLFKRARYAIYILSICVIIFGCTNDKDILGEIFYEQSELVLKYAKLHYENLSAGNVKVALAYGDSCKMAFYAEHVVYMKMYPKRLSHE